MNTGKCHICGKIKELSFEHIPPRSAFNNQRVSLVKGAKTINRAPGDLSGAKIQQKGAGKYSLCKECNSITGAYYGNYFSEFATQIGKSPIEQGKENFTDTQCKINPLPVIKQIISCFFSVNSENFCDQYPSLVDFILNKENNTLDKRFKFYCYASVGPVFRNAELCIMVKQTSSNEIINYIVSEFNFIPLGFTMFLDSENPDKRLLEITNFSGYKYSESIQMEIKLPVLETHLVFPNDYRNIEQINAEANT